MRKASKDTAQNKPGNFDQQTDQMLLNYFLSPGARRLGLGVICFLLGSSRQFEAGGVGESKWLDFVDFMRLAGERK